MITIIYNVNIESQKFKDHRDQEKRYPFLVSFEKFRESIVNRGSNLF